MFKKRRGISEMIAVVLLLIIVSVAGIALYRTSLGSMNEQYTNFSEQVNDQTQAAKERFEVVSTQAVAESRDLYVYVFNYSPDKGMTTKVSSIYIDKLPCEWTQDPADIPPGAHLGELPRNTVVRFRIIAEMGEDFSSWKSILIVSQRGVGYEYS